MYSSYSGIATTAGIGLVLMVLAFIAAIVVTVLLYRKFISSQKPIKVPGAKYNWAPFFRFENLIVEKILQALFIFTACLIAFESAASIITSIVSIAMYPYGAGAALTSIIAALIVCVVLEVINRVGFEFSIMTVLICKNTTAIRAKVCGDASQTVHFAGDNEGEKQEQPKPPVSVPVDSTPTKPAPADTQRYSRYNTEQYTGHPASSPVMPPQASAAITNIPSPVESAAPSTNPVVPTAPEKPSEATQVNKESAEHKEQESESIVSKPSEPAFSTQWKCVSCGHINQSGKFCSQCGTPRK